jgi:hypothetical protein
MSNAKTKSVPIQQVMRSAAFVRGFQEARAKKPFRDDAVSWEHSWSYERGRQFAVIYSGPLKSGRRLVFAAVYAYHQALNSRAII